MRPWRANRPNDETKLQSTMLSQIYSVNSPEYVHGRSGREAERLQDQANALADLLHSDTRYSAGDLVLEAGCGVGSQTIHLAGRSPGARIAAVDIASESLRLARDRLRGAGHEDAMFLRGDVHCLPFRPGTFDHLFVCFLLEHLNDPLQTLRALGDLVRPGGSITAIEGDHGSAFFYPASGDADRTISGLVELQRRAGGDALIGRRMYPLLTGAGFEEVCVSPRFVYVDGSRPDLARGFTLDTFTAMVEGVFEKAIGSGMITDAAWQKGIRDLKRTALPDGVFCYTFFKGTATKGRGSLE